MDEKPKSIWKKSWIGWRGFLLSSVLVFAVVEAIGCLAGADPGLTVSIAGILVVVSMVMVFGACLFRWLFSWRNFKRFLFAFACIATLIALFYAEEDWRGRHDWEKFKREWEAKGEKFDLKDFIPSSVPDDQNFAFSPVWIADIKSVLGTNRAYSWYHDGIYSPEVSNTVPELASVEGWSGTNIWNHPSYSSLPQMPVISSGWLNAQLTDLKPWQIYYRDLQMTNPAAAIPITAQPQTPAQDVLLALSKFDPVIKQLRRDSTLPYSRFPVQYDTDDPAAILLPHLAAIKRNSQVLQLRAIAELQAGQTDKAFADVKLMLCLMDSVQTEPFIITHLVRIAILEITVQPIYEGLAEHEWSDAQLAELNSELAGVDFLADYQKCLHADLAATDMMIDYVEKNPVRFWIFTDWGSPNQQELRNKLNQFDVAMEVYLMPKGWWEQNKIVVAKVAKQYLFPIVENTHRTVSPQRTDAAEEFQNSLRPTPFNMLAIVLAWPGINEYTKKAAFGQNAADLARVAIALERYRLAHGEFPESLDALAPQFMEKIPHDVIGGGPLHYRGTSDGQFVLYSVGWNETDDGGVVVLKKGSSGEVDINQGDWVWRYPQK